MILTLRIAMVSREGKQETDFQIGRGLSAFAVERTNPHRHNYRPQTTIVFGKSPSDAKRRASAPARLAEEIHEDVTRVARITTGWDEPFNWPTEGWR
jgi:hypothetical protein